MKRLFRLPVRAAVTVGVLSAGSIQTERIGITILQSSRRMLTGIALAFATTACQSGAPAAQAPPPVAVQLQTLQSESITESTEFVGTLEAKRRVTLQPESTGRVTLVEVNAGDQVGAGQVLFELRLEQVQSQVDSAQAGAEGQRAALRDAQAERRAAEAETARLRAEVQRQRAELESRQADLDLAQVNYDRSESLVNDGVRARQDLDDKTRALNTARAAVKAGGESLNASIQALNASLRRLEGADARVEQGIANVNRAVADVQVRQEDVGFRLVNAPIAGTVGDVPVKLGDYVTSSSVLTTIVQRDFFDLRLAIPVERSPQLRVGLPVQAVDESGKLIVNGQISFVDPQVNTTAQSILAKATFANTGDRLRDGQFVRARVLWNREPGLTIPTTAITRLGGQSFVFVAEQTQQDGQNVLVARQRPVTLGSIQGNAYHALDGVNQGDRIAVTNILKLRDGAPIQPATAQPTTAQPTARPPES